MDRYKYLNVEPVNRTGTYCEKYDSLKEYFGSSDLFPLWVADMDLATPSFVVDAIKSRAEHPLYGYTKKYNEIFDAIKFWMNSEHGVILDKKHISLSPSVQTTILNGIRGLSKTGDTVLIFSPVYGPFFSAVKNLERRVSDFPLDVINNRFEMDFNRLETVLKKDKPAILLFCSPHNPGGRVWSREELENLVALCQKYGVKIISDEIHSDIVFDPYKHISLLTVEGAGEITIAAHSASKTFNTAGLAASFILTYNSEFKKIMDREAAATHTDNVNLFGKVSITSAFTSKGRVYKKELMEYLSATRDLTVKKIGGIKGVEVMIPEATYLVWCDFRKLGSWPKVMRRLKERAGVALSGGEFFGPAGAGWFRINTAYPFNVLNSALDKIADEFKGK